MAVLTALGVLALGVVTGVTVPGDPFPPALHGDLLVGAYSGQAIYHLSMSDDGTRFEGDEVWSSSESIVALGSAPDDVYYSTPEAVKRIRPLRGSASASASSPSPDGYTDGGNAAPLAVVGGLLVGGLVITLLLLARRGR